MGFNQPVVDTSPKVSDEVRKTTCYMCACRCGINVHMKEGKVAYIEGNKDHPVNQGVLCAKGSAGIMQVNAPSRLRAPMKRVGERGSGEFEEITWEEAYDIAVSKLKPIRDEDPSKLAFFTGRDQSQSFTSLWAQGFGTPNYAAHGGFCSVNMAAAGIYTMGGAFWEFGQPDWDHTKMLMIFGVAEDHDSNPIKMGLGKIKARGAKVVGVNPIRSGYNAVADEWVGITPGTDGLFILSMLHCLIKAGKIDLEYLSQFTNAPVLLDETNGSAEEGLFLKDKDGKALVIDRNTGKLAPFDGKGVYPDLAGTHRKAGVTHRTVFHYMIERYMSEEYAPEAVAERCGISAKRIRKLAAELADVAFNQAIELDRPWTDFAARSMIKWWGGPFRSTRCAEFQHMLTAFKPAARCMFCKSCSALLKRRAACGSNHPTPSQQLRTPNRTAKSLRALRLTGHTWASPTGQMTFACAKTAVPHVSIKRSHGKTPCPRTA